jgi:predicted RNA-binding Zn ribbon-like protein
LTGSGQTHAELLVDLINTHYLGDRSDVLAEVGASGWLREHLGHQPRNAKTVALTPLRRLREGLRQLAIANNGGQPDESIVAPAEAALRNAPITVTLGEGDRGRVVRSAAPAGTAQHVVGMVAIAYLSSQLEGTWRRVKACAEPNCRWAFLDLSRNSSRRWCDMSECGNRAKNRAWRFRQST